MVGEEALREDDDVARGERRMQRELTMCTTSGAMAGPETRDLAAAFDPRGC